MFITRNFKLLIMPLKLPTGELRGLDIIQFNIRPPAGPVVKYPVRKKDGVSDNNSVKKD